MQDVLKGVWCLRQRVLLFASKSYPVWLKFSDGLSDSLLSIWLQGVFPHLGLNDFPHEKSHS